MQKLTISRNSGAGVSKCPEDIAAALANRRKYLARVLSEDADIRHAAWKAARAGKRPEPIDPISAGLEAVRQHMVERARNELNNINSDLAQVGVDIAA